MAQQNKMAYAMIRAAVEKGVQDLKDSPRRGIRNLVELGDIFAKGRFQKDFFHAAQKQLCSERSAYYRLVERLARNTSAHALTTFGMNLGYNCWTQGAAQIRELEEKEGFNVPWCLVFDLEGKGLSPKRLAEIMNQGRALGIHCYLFRVDRRYPSMDGLLNLLAMAKDCACFLLVPPGLLTGERIAQIRTAGTILTAVELEVDDPALADAVRLLTESQCLFGAYARYDAIAESAAALLPTAAERGIPFLILIDAKKKCPRLSDDTPGAVEGMRKTLKYPVLPLDLYRDIAQVDRNISSEGCVAIVSGDGTMLLADAEHGEARNGYDLGTATLREILADALPKQ